MDIICDCGEEMTLTMLEADQSDEQYLGYDCTKCGASMYGTHRLGVKEPEAEEV